ncbi:MAG: hypothetical protein CVU41_13815 [Chloroflexi bacterium HGW-Chloroflexi-3]|nr:MAG: hypothetical protein CVU41_13815 [Chloroflexi bacterium HGW-Chloroflexi-3]
MNASTSLLVPVENLTSSVEPEMQARVFALMSSVGTAMVPLGLMIAGPISDHFSIQSWFLMGGLICILMAIVAMSIPAVINLENKKEEPNKAATNIVFELN